MKKEKIEVGIKLAQTGRSMEEVFEKTLELVDSLEEGVLMDYIRNNLPGYGMILEVIRENRPEIWKKLSLKIR